MAESPRLLQVLQRGQAIATVVRAGVTRLVSVALFIHLLHLGICVVEGLSRCGREAVDHARIGRLGAVP